MQSPLRPAHPVPGFADRRLRSTNDGKGHFFYGGCTRFSPSPRASPLATPFTPSPSASPRSTPSPRSPTSSSGSLVDDAVATEHRAVLQYKTTPDDHYERCVAHLADAAREAAALRLENEDLRVANSDLASRFAMLGRDQATSGLLLGQMQMRATPAEKHSLMPKSISIRRSTGRGGGHGKGLVTNKIGQQALSVDEDEDGAKAEEHQVGAGEKRGQVLKATGGLDFKLYSQGTLKTELCHNWEKTGLCPYDDQCRFAHGIAELRPVSRHPRYKTHTCRLFASGRCSYGHRCHFRHSIIPGDHLLRP